MKHLWALLSTLVLSLALVVAGVAAWAGAPADNQRADLAASSVGSFTTTSVGHGLLWQLATPQAVLPGVFLVSRRDAHHGSHGTRSDRQFFEISSTGSNDVPEAALRAYHHAEKVMAIKDPGCHISWTLLAAIGRVESNHGRFGGAQLGADGISRPEIRGPQLNGAGAFAAIRDSDHGTLDHDVVWDRAVGQMQFLPETWRSVARDGDGDGKMNPDDVDDSALGSAVYLCGAGGSLADPAGAARAAFRYNHSDYYVQLVLSFQAGYQTGVFALPSPPPPPVKAPKAPKRHTPGPKPRHLTKPRATQPKPAAAAPSAAPKPAPKPAPSPSPKPTPTPAGPQLVSVAGTWNACVGGGFCLGTTALDLGTIDRLAEHANADYDADGTVETNLEEFTGLVGKHVSLRVERKPGGLEVFLIDGHDYRNADGSFARTATTSASLAPTTTP